MPSSSSRGLPPGPNVGTQLRARRAAKARAERQAREAAEQAQRQLTRRSQQLSLPSAEGWFAAHGWTPFAFQRQVWEHVAAGRSGLLHATTGAGKTYAVWFALLNRVLAGEVAGGGLRMLWITPMRALSADTARALEAPLDELGLDWDVGVRTGDTEAAERTRQGKRLPEALVTTPESLSLLLTRADAPQLFAGVQMVVVDEWHELVGSKRGVQVQLALARVQRWTREAGRRAGAAADVAAAAATTPAVASGAMSTGMMSTGTMSTENAALRPHPGSAPGASGAARPSPSGSGTDAEGAAPPAHASLAIWGLSATLGNSVDAMHALLSHRDGVLVQGHIDKEIVVDTLLPDEAGRFPWGGHLGIQMLAPVVREVASAGTTIVFTNTRSQAEIWYQSILQAKPQWAGLIALHHGSLDKAVRDWVEAGLKAGTLKAVVATSSLDLGVDFLPVERVLQIGSPKGVARLLQRAGRSGHAPGRVSRVTLVPTNALELIEAAAAQKAAAARRVESRHAPRKPLDVLVQHLVTVAIGTGFDDAELLAEVRSTASYATLTDDEWHWCLDFVGRGGDALRAYPEYRRVLRGDDGVFRVPDAAVARRHKMSVGTIVAESSMLVKYMPGRGGSGKLGHIEESFIARLRKGDAFTFGGKRLALVQVREMTAFVEPARRNSGAVPRWSGAKMPLSTEMADAVLEELEAAIVTLDRNEAFAAPEMQRVAPLLAIQRRWSAIPTRDTLLLESWQSREGRHLYCYPFAGRHAHLGLASLLAYRLGKQQPATFSMAVNDYGFELMTVAPVDWIRAWRPDAGLLDEEGLLDDILASLNAGELAARRFREIARVSGLIFQGYPGQPKSTRQLQASSSLIYEVLRKYDAGNRLLGQADREVLDQELDLARLRMALARMRGQRRVLKSLSRPTPFAFPLLVERLREQLTTEKLADRIARMVAELEKQAAAG
jgi:ATP-dependent Lhr-like helicase